MTLLEIESRPVDSVASRDRDWPTAPTPSGLLPTGHTSVLTLVTVTVAGGESPPDPEEQEDYEELAAARFRLNQLPRLDDLVLTVVQTDSDGAIQRWSGSSAAGAGIPSGPGAVLHLQPAASHHVAAQDRSVAIQADRNRRPSRDGYTWTP